MKNKLPILMAMFLFLLFLGTSQVYAYSITPSGPSLLYYGDETSQSQITGILNGYFEPDLVLLYSQDVDYNEDGLLIDDEGPLADSYQTSFSNSEEDPSDALIDYLRGESIGAPSYLLVKDGNQSPAWYFFNVTAWNGTDDLLLTGFWPRQGAISHVSLYGTSNPVPEPATMLLLGSGLVGLASFGRRKFKKN